MKKKIEFVGRYSEMTNEGYAVANDFVKYYNDEETCEDVYDGLSEYIVENYIYNSDQWRLLQTYCTPQNANLAYAFEELTNEVLSNIAEV